METACVSVPYIDTHCHLFMLEHAPLEEILERAKQAQIVKMVSVSTDEGSWESNRNFAAKYPQVYYTLGMHPHEAKHWAECAPTIHQAFENGVPEKCVGIGEIGLDFHYYLSPREIQLDVLVAQLELAKRVKLPIVIHCRDSFDILYEQIRNIGLSDRGGVMHCFTGNPNQAKDALDLGLVISFSGIVTFKKADTLRAAAKMVPLSSIVIETDCPFLAPIPLRGKPNEPAFLAHTGKFLAEWLGVSEEKFAQTTTENATRLFEL